MRGHYVRGSERHGGGDQRVVCFISDAKIFLFNGCTTEKLRRFRPPV